MTEIAKKAAKKKQLSTRQRQNTDACNYIALFRSGLEMFADSSFTYSTRLR